MGTLRCRSTIVGEREQLWACSAAAPPWTSEQEPPGALDVLHRRKHGSPGTQHLRASGSRLPCSAPDGRARAATRVLLRSLSIHGRAGAAVAWSTAALPPTGAQEEGRGRWT